MRKYNKEMDKYKKLYFRPYEVLKAYLFAGILAFLISLIAYLPLLNLLYLNRYFTIIMCLLLVVTLFWIYLMLYFKDKVLESYNSDAKNVNLFYIRVVDISIVSIVAIVAFIILMFSFGW